MWVCFVKEHLPSISIRDYGWYVVQNILVTRHVPEEVTTEPRYVPEVVTTAPQSPSGLLYEKLTCAYVCAHALYMRTHHI